MIDPKLCCGKSTEDTDDLYYKSLNRPEEPAYKVGRGVARNRWATCGNDEQKILSVCKDCAVKFGIIW